MRLLVVALLAAWLALGGCEKSQPPATSGGAPSGLPQGETPPPVAPAANPHGGAGGGMPADPHAGLDMGGADPHAGMGGMGGDPHGGMGDMGGAPAAKPVDPNMVLEGTIDVSPKLKAQVKAGDTLFLSVKSVDAAGTPQRIPIAADRQTAGSFPMTFRLTGAHTMMQGTKFEGDVLISVRVDRDGEAMTRAKGDIEGTARARIPARGLKILLDTPVP